MVADHAASVSLLSNGLYVQGYQSSGGLRGEISFIPGKVVDNSAGTGVVVSAPQQHDTGFYPSVSVNNAGVVMTVHVDRSSKVGNSALYYQMGVINPDGDISQSVQWIYSAYQYDNGWNPKIAINDKMQIIEVHQTSRSGSFGLLYRVGTILQQGSPNSYGPEWAGNNGVQYDTGVNPQVSLDNNGNVVEVHQEAGNGNLHYRRGRISNDSIVGEPAAANARYVTATNSVGMPAMAVNDNGGFLEVHVLNPGTRSPEVATFTGQLDPNSSNNINLSGSTQLHGGTHPGLSANNDYAILIDRETFDSSMRFTVGKFTCPAHAGALQ